MKSFEEYEAAAREGSPFSNSTEWEIWQFNACMGAGNDSRRCVNDDNDDCPLVMLAVQGCTPAEWTGPRGRYQCSEKTTPAQARAAAAQARRQAGAELQRQIDESHYPMFGPDELR
ncbi:hypothetical protein [Nocardia sp. NPDC059239]|uniref:hypothetical protein n=1 Tax=unclassified Nocardia TaxID=2637762 RepID=UPI0036CA6119